ncbi:secreted RxLR effector peptide protein, putative [Phytophthora infestans T30-4]|uniref:RxLR effector protein n=1 Tax=Phytophthora infestans (strain T30-4) TaxID=403677 RepID=D0NCK5_PHYIT|nr:secreted RxLR effector peptide protein, putative [Phytophthora infestans T30-4]EEY55719.1 secreted RxLR effector peptide protein, putative [Phytophthora infestans T30-4]|eukprot:XP_002903295.1 secreted RxLR effector peptide protein, putative [Phytophthora infestans T30-4]
MRVRFILCAVPTIIAGFVNGISTAGTVDLDMLASPHDVVQNSAAAVDHATNNAHRLLRKHEPTHDGAELEKYSGNEERDLWGAFKGLLSR